MNEVKISGKIYNVKEAHTTSGKVISTFGLSVWNGKKDGNNTYEFINCKFWGNIGNKDGDKIIQGKLTFDVWEKDGKKVSKPVILVETIRKSEFNNQQTGQVEQSSYDDLDDDVIF